MSGTSLDGMDIAYCRFSGESNSWTCQIEVAETIPYNETWLTRLRELHKQPMFVLPKTDAYYGKYIGQCVNDFIKRHNLTVDFIASHGHTIFHDPAGGYTTQIGSGAAVYAETGIPTVCDFRSVDVALGGQGAPLVPVGDELLFAEYDACLNLGGFANISYKESGKRVAFDIAPCNLVLNTVARQLDIPYDDGGLLAASGTVNAGLLEKLNTLPYYQLTGARSLGREWLEQQFWPVVSAFSLTINDLLATLAAHIAQQISKVINKHQLKTILITGGGAYNTHLIQSVEKIISQPLPIPDAKLIEFKEALLFAFLGVLRVTGQFNALQSVTGARNSSIGGAVYGIH